MAHTKMSFFLTRNTVSSGRKFPRDYQMRVERLSEYMASTGRSYKNHLATIRSWAKREKPKYNPADYTFEEGDSL